MFTKKTIYQRNIAVMNMIPVNTIWFESWIESNYLKEKKIWSLITGMKLKELKRRDETEKNKNKRTGKMVGSHRDRFSILPTKY